MNGLTLHKKLEQNSGLLIFGILLISSIGGLVQILPILFQQSLSTPANNIQPYDAIALTGRDIYIREGCSVCHSQQVRPLIAEVERYGPYSKAGEFVYDRPFLWGSKRTGPDLHRIGQKYSDAWHRVHLINPRSVVKDSIMPAYPWLAKRPANANVNIRKKMRALNKFGHQYTDQEIEDAQIRIRKLKEIDALIYYLQGLGVNSNSSEPNTG